MSNFTTIKIKTISIKCYKENRIYPLLIST